MFLELEDCWDVVDGAVAEVLDQFEGFLESERPQTFLLSVEMRVDLTRPFLNTRKELLQKYSLFDQPIRGREGQVQILVDPELTLSLRVETHIDIIDEVKRHLMPKQNGISFQHSSKDIHGLLERYRSKVTEPIRDMFHNNRHHAVIATGMIAVLSYYVVDGDE